ncbi:sporulation integral membrane protein YlbJ [Paenibacillus yanchengensis]|uniref:Sporulation integral membrane protein YlbJ n=1 Tax=Paenibacillus yanchengensis TaxID=2035833 RepID=A0ABW4YG66_9BACL
MLTHPLSITALVALLFTLLMAIFPVETLQSSLRGLSIWWDVLFPSLFPFFIISEIMLGIGVVHFVGKLLDPIMKPLFRVPGIGGFVFAMGYISGYPVGARLTSQLREQGLVSRVEGERLVAFTTTSDPIFLIGAVSVGFYKNVAVAPILAIAHYGGGILIGLCMRFYGNRVVAHSSNDKEVETNNKNRLSSAFEAMHAARLKDGRTIGKLLQDAIESSLKLMFVVGGLVVFFSVLMELLTQTGLMQVAAQSLRHLFTLVGMPPSLADAILHGLFEVTLGARSAAEAHTYDTSGSSIHLMLVHQVAIGAFILSWAGLSVHAQIASLLSKTDMRYAPLLFARLIHGIISALLVYLLWNWLGV